MDPDVIRVERPDDVDAIRRVHLDAFGGALEARIVDRLRREGGSVISLVATDGTEVVGHVLFSPVAIAEAPQGFRALGLGPVGVRPSFQGRGFGSALIREGLRRSENDGVDAVVLIGEPAYYSRFGFVPAGPFGLENEWDVHDAFLIRPRGGAARLEAVRGLVKYDPVFSLT